MNALITRYKRAVLSAVVLVTLGCNSAQLTGCSPCQAAAAARQSARDAAIAQSLLANKPNARAMELDDIDAIHMNVVKCNDGNVCNCVACPALAENKSGDADRCPSCAQKKSVQEALAALAAAVIVAKGMELDSITPEDLSRAPRESGCPLCNEGCDDRSACDLNGQIQTLITNQALCCATISGQLACQGQAAEKCCKKLGHKITKVEELVESALDQSITCCSVTATTLGSILDQSAACCSVMELNISNLSASVADVFALLMSVWDCTCDT